MGWRDAPFETSSSPLFGDRSIFESERDLVLLKILAASVLFLSMEYLVRGNKPIDYFSDSFGFYLFIPFIVCAIINSFVKITSQKDYRFILICIISVSMIFGYKIIIYVGPRPLQIFFNYLLLNSGEILIVSLSIIVSNIIVTALKGIKRN